MPDPRIQNLANILVNYSSRVKPGDWVSIWADLGALPLVKEVLAQVLKAGGNPTYNWHSNELDEIYYSQASKQQLEWISPLEELRSRKVDVGIYIYAEENTRTLTNTPSENMALKSASRREIFETEFKRAADGDFRWVVTQFPTQAYAQDADMSLADYEDFVYKACFADQDDPVGAWQKVHDEQEKLVRWMKGKKNIRMKSPNVDLTLSIEGRPFENADGKSNMPSGEIFTSPVENSINGWVEFSYPAIHHGREVDGVRFEFKDGKVVHASAKKNEEFLLSQLDLDEGARYIGEWAIGTNYGIQQFTRSILYDEKIGGTFHMAVGAGYPETGSQNKSAIHWDFICDIRRDSEVHVDGELFYKDGQFQV